MNWTVQPVKNPALQQLLEGHPIFQVEGEESNGICFHRENWNRQVLVGEPGFEAINGALYGLIELCDNNPLVCADVFSVPSPEATLALIGLGPLVRAGLLIEDPVVQLSFTPLYDDLEESLRLEGFSGEVVAAVDDQDLGSVLAAVCMAEIPLMDNYDEIDELYNEAYGRSFFVRPVDALYWDAEQVRGLDHAVYSLRVSLGEDRALVTCLVMADAQGKCGPAQIVHAMNVMCGFEECLGLQVPQLQ